MSNFRISLVAATISTALLALPLIAEAATTATLHAKPGSGMMSGGSHGGNAMMGNGMGGGMQGMMGMMAMMNAGTRVMNKMADNMGHGAMGGRSGGMMR